MKLLKKMEYMQGNILHSVKKLQEKSLILKREDSSLYIIPYSSQSIVKSFITLDPHTTLQQKYLYLQHACKKTELRPLH